MSSKIGRRQNWRPADHLDDSHLAICNRMRIPKYFSYCISIAIVEFVVLANVDTFAMAEGLDRFDREIRPILQTHCWSCHGSDKQESGLRLDQRDAAFLGGDSGKAILPGNSQNSRLLERVTSTDPDHVMPPKGDRLGEVEIERLKKWIDEGASWPADLSTRPQDSQHWAYQPIKKLTPPSVRRTDWPANAIDFFVLKQLEQRGIQPSDEAERHTLIRRLYLDLLGVLPTIQDVEKFAYDQSPNAYEKLVDEILRSPHFGERWGRHWLDMARYADSDGYEKDNARPDAYRWRDWVIDAINQDMPFDQFTIEQLAGDLLPNATDMQRLATAFHRQTLTNTEGGTDQEQFRFEACFDRTETTGAIWLGLTVGCARCHSHKYDTITQREYYQLFDFFNNADEQTHVVPKSNAEIDQYQRDKKEHDAIVHEHVQSIENAIPQVRSTLAVWEANARSVLDDLSKNPFLRETLLEQKINSTPSVKFAIQKDASYLVSGENPDKVTYVLQGRTTGKAFDTLRLDVLADKSLPAKGPGRVKHGNFVLSEIKLEIAKDESFQQVRTLHFHDSRADHEQGKKFLIRQAYDGDDSTGWAIGNQYGKDHWAEFRLSEKISDGEPEFVRITLVQNHGNQHTLGRFRVSLQLGTEPKMAIPENIAKILAVAESERSPTQSRELLEHVARVTSPTKERYEQLEALKKKEPDKPELSVRVLAQRQKDRRTTYVLRRGEFLEPIRETEIAPAGFSTMPALVSRNGAVPDRLDLARWLVSREHPLVSRVTVNHIWRTLFGTGLVKTAGDFGVRGEKPSHPELLDWLARDFMEDQGWSRKRLIKQIVMSSTYRQSSRTRDDLQTIDPNNQWLARQNRLRVEGEVVRDLCLDAAGLLSRKIGGPSVYPSLPPGIAELSYAGNFKWKTSEGEDRYRRGMYTFFKRTSPHPNLITFDCPDANLACLDRNKSNTPLQALVLLNNDTFAEAARALAKRVLTNKELSTDAIRIAWAVKSCLARTPTESEIHEFRALLEANYQWYLGHADQAIKLIDTYTVDGLSSAEVAAWVATSRIMLNLDEFITRE